MQVKNLFEKEVYDETLQRLNKLTPATQRLWGKMDVAQMMAHCIEAFKVPLANRKLPKLFPLSLIGPLFKKKLYEDKPWRQGLPTASNFKIKDERNFEIEKKGLLELVTKFYTLGPSGAGLYPHPVFGKFTSEQWGKAMWKHLDHHLRQFGV
ncbi:MAG: DUF1569 domain-containing protein [Chitinophagaceae bacterium]